MYQRLHEIVAVCRYRLLVIWSVQAEPWKAYFTVQEYRWNMCSRNCIFSSAKGDYVFYFYCMSLSLCMRQFNVSDSLKACFEMVLFFGISGKLLCLVMNLPNCGWCHDPSKSVTTCYPEDRGNMFIQNVSQVHGITAQQVVIFTDNFYLQAENLAIFILTEYCSLISTAIENTVMII